MSLVSVHNEWDPLEEIIVGTAIGAQIPKADVGLHAITFTRFESPQAIPSGPYPERIVAQTEEELGALSKALEAEGVKVRRPAPRDIAAPFGTPDWQTDGYFDYCPRDGFLAVGETIIETPMVLRSRFFEYLAYRDLFMEYFESGAKWFSAPKPRLLDSAYLPQQKTGDRLSDAEICFDAANIIRLGTDILYLVSDSGNERGWKWLQSVLGDKYTVHPCRKMYASTHIDSTIVALRPGLVLLNPERVNDDNMPSVIKGWDKIWCPPLVETEFYGDHPNCSKWIGMNLLVVRPDLVVVDRRQPALIKALEAQKMKVLPLQLTHARTFGGGFHCVTLDVRRSGGLQTYR